jgi:hypothetical protein
MRRSAYRTDELVKSGFRNDMDNLTEHIVVKFTVNS